jgi:hypothetical protein
MTTKSSVVEFGDSIVLGNFSPEIVSHTVLGDMFEIYDYGNPDDIKTISSVKV